MRKNNRRAKISLWMTLYTLVFNSMSISGQVYVKENREVDTVLAPITWQRSSENQGEVLGVREGRWNWNIASSIETPIKETEYIWDAPYNPYYTGYINSMGLNIHSAATWKTQNQVDLRRFKGSFTIPEGYSTEDFVRLRSVVQNQYSNLNEGNIVAINDNLYVFIYPEEISHQITDDSTSPYYFANFLAFWTGTANRLEYGIQTFYGKPGTYAVRDTINGPKVTDGWYAEASIDNIGMVMHNTTKGAGAGTRFIIDIFTEDNSQNAGGGMDEMVLEFTSNPNAVIQVKNESYAILSNKETSILGKNSLIANDGPEGIISCDLVEKSIEDFEIKKSKNNTYSIYKLNQLVAQINYIDESGQFTIKPVDDYVGRIVIPYRVYDKLGISEEAYATIYVMPKVEIHHIDMNTNEVLKKHEVLYGNPYSKLPEDIIYLNGTTTLNSSLSLECLSELDEKYRFVDGEKIFEGNIIEHINRLPYNYTYQYANEVIILKYKKKESHLKIRHLYSQDEALNYEEPIEVAPEDKIRIEDYIDTTGKSNYIENEKYFVEKIIVTEKDKVILEQEIKEYPIKVEDIMTLLGDKEYQVDIYYGVKMYKVNEKHIYGQDNEFIEIIEKYAPFGTEYAISSIEKEGYCFEKYVVDKERNYTEFITISEDINITYYYTEKIQVPEESKPSEPEQPDDNILVDIDDEKIPGGIVSDDIDQNHSNQWNIGGSQESSQITKPNGASEKDDKNVSTSNPLTQDNGITKSVVILAGAVLGSILVNKKKK